MPATRVLSTLPSLAAAVGLLSGCFGAPTPLAPAIGGSPGAPHHGSLQAGQRLPQKGQGYVRFRLDGTRWGNPRLVSAITRAAAEVDRLRPAGAPLVIADVSARAGGKIPRHRSHRSGRDIDVLFFTKTLDGRPTRTPGFLHFGADGLARVKRGQYLLLDVDRTWLLVRTLVRDESAQMQWLFVARWVEALLIEHALARGEDLETIWRAQKLLHQPGDSFPHDDHFHMRIACTPNEEVGGCRAGGYRWPWLAPRPAAPSASDDALLAAMFDEDERDALTDAAP